MAKKKKEVIVEPEEEEVTCPVCGRPVGLDVKECPHCGAEFEAEEVEEIPETKPASKAKPAVTESPVDEGEMADCPVCGRSVSLSVSSCPHCGAEFESEEVEEVVETAPPAKPTPKPTVVATPADEEETAECPVCGKAVGLSVKSCPHCGAEFEEEEVEEIIEVEEKPTAPAAQPARVSRPVPVAEEVEEETVEVEAEEPEPELAEAPTSITDLRVIGVALIALGIIGSQISFMINWYWTWVPPIKNNLGMFVGIAAAVIVVGLLVFMLVKRASGNGRKVPKQTPGMALSVLLFGIMALVLIMLWNPINNALQSSNLGVGVLFVVLFVVGVVMMLVRARTSSATAS